MDGPIAKVEEIGCQESMCGCKEFGKRAIEQSLKCATIRPEEKAARDYEDNDGINLSTLRGRLFLHSPLCGTSYSWVILVTKDSNNL